MRSNFRAAVFVTAAISIMAGSTSAALAVPSPSTITAASKAFSNNLNSVQAVTDECSASSSLTIKLDDGTVLNGIEAQQLVGMEPALAKETINCAPDSVSGPWVGRKQFTSGDRAYEKTDGNGKFTAQYTPGLGTYVAWLWMASAPLKAVAISPVTARVDRTPPNCSYSKTQSIAYMFHGSCPNHSFSTDYALNGNMSFRVNVSGNTGTATVRWTFNYLIRSV